MYQQAERINKKITRWLIITAAAWLILVSASYICNRMQVKASMMQLAKSELEASFDKDVIYRQWAAGHGGVYVPITEGTPPNPYLSHLPNRDVTTTSGLRLTLVNPAYMTRQVHELGKADYKMKGHITSLKPLRPENIPDAWETGALKSFEAGVKEAFSVVALDGISHIRLMRPFIVTPACLKCHGSQGYKKGEIRGGISVSTPMTFYVQKESEQLFPLLVAHFLIGGLGLAGLFYASRLSKKYEQELRESDMRFRQIYDHMEVGVAHVALDFKIEHANHAYCRMLGYREEELVGKSLAEITHPEVVEENLQKQKLLGAGKIHHYRMEKRFIHKEGHTVHGILDANLIFDVKNIPQYFLGSVVDITQRKLAEEALKESEAQKELILNTTAEMVIYYDTELRVIWANRASAQVAGVPPEKLVGRRCHEIWFHQNAPCRDCPVIKALETKTPCHDEKQMPDKRWRALRAYPVLDEKGRVTALVEFGLDITEQKEAVEENKRLEQQFYQAQKMESIGRLAGGVAHELNNLLSPILGYGEMLLYKETGIPPEDAAQEIVKASLQARDLVRQLLAFGRKQPLKFTFIDLNTLLQNFEKLLRRTLREEILIDMVLFHPLPFIKGDVGQIEQVVLNLAINAQDAMPDGGRLLFETGSVELDKNDAARHEDATPGEYVILSISDTGRGMDSETQNRIFEPFFTTKKSVKSNGLGLAAIYGIVKQHGGNIWVYSEPEMGTTLKVYLPAFRDDIPLKNKLPLKLSGPSAQCSETILLVEDNESVRNLTSAILKKEGYELLAAPNGPKALRLLEQHKKPVHLLLTDVVMPEMNGRQVFEQAARLCPDLKVIYMSGYTDEIIARHGVLEEGMDFIEKPFSNKALAGKVREVLNRSQASV